MMRLWAVRWSTWAIEGLLPRSWVEAVIGDLQEELQLRSDAGPLANSCWYLGQLIRSVVPLTWTAIRRGGWFITLGVGVAAFYLANTLEYRAGLLVLPPFADLPQLKLAVSLIVGLSAMTLSGYLAAWVRPAAPIILSVLILVFVLRWTAGAGSTPLWYEIGFLVFGPLSALKGGTLSSNRR